MSPFAYLLSLNDEKGQAANRLALLFYTTYFLVRAAERLDFSFRHRTGVLHGRGHDGAVVRHQVDFNATVLVGFAGFRTLALLGVGRSALAGPGFGGLVGSHYIHLDARDVNLTAGARTTTQNGSGVQYAGFIQIGSSSGSLAALFLPPATFTSSSVSRWPTKMMS